MTTDEVAAALTMVRNGWRPDQALCEDWLAAIKAKNAEIIRVRDLVQFAFIDGWRSHQASPARRLNHAWEDSRSRELLAKKLPDQEVSGDEDRT